MVRKDFREVEELPGEPQGQLWEKRNREQPVSLSWPEEGEEPRLPTPPLPESPGSWSKDD